MKTTVAAEPIFSILDGPRSLFARHAMNLIAARDGYEIVALCRAQPIDLVLVPFSMGAVTGAAVCRSLQSLPSPPLTLLFADTAEQAKAIGKDAAISDVIVGVMDGRDLLIKCARMLGVPLRQDVRILVRLRVEASSVEGTHLVLGTIIDISTSGMLVETTSAVTPGDVLSAEFYLPGQSPPMVMMLKVARLDESDPAIRKLGLSFMRSQDDMVARIRQFIHARAAKG